MKNINKITSILLISAMTLSACTSTVVATTETANTETVRELTSEEITQKFLENNKDVLLIKEQGVFSSGGTVTEPVDGEYDYTKNWQDTTRKGATAHIDHANVFYQIPVNDDKLPVVFLHGYGQSRVGWQTTPDGREGFADYFLKNGHPVYLVDQPRRGEAGSTTTMTTDGFLDVWSEDSKDYKPGDQSWYTHFRIGRVAPDRYEGSKFPEGDEAQNQFFRQMTPNTGTFDLDVNAKALNNVFSDIKNKTNKKSIYVAHSQGCTVAFNNDYENVAAIVFIEPGAAPAVDSEQYQNLLSANIPVVFYYGDFLGDRGPEEIESTAFWKNSLDSARTFRDAFNLDGGDCTVYYLPDENITGNSHFMFQETNNKEIADHIENWLESKIDNQGVKKNLINKNATKEDMVFEMGDLINAPTSFTGNVYIKQLIQNESEYNFPTTNVVTFEKGARSGMHSHGNMILLVTSGIGYYKEEGKPAQIIRKGDIVECPAGVNHWHGAVPDSWFQQIVIYDDKYENSTHGELISDDEYLNVEKEEFNGRTMSEKDLFMFKAGDEKLKLDTFNGEVRLSELLSENNILNMPSMHYVVFDKGVINNWHTHEGGQILIATDGIGFHQVEGGEVEILRPGDVVFCPKGVKHWHGGSLNSEFAHIAVNTNKELTGLSWGDIISNDEYLNINEKIN